MNVLELMGAPFAECLILVAIHTYLGLHVLKRRVIFVDLALAQIAALGTTVGFLFGIMPDTPAALLFSIAFTFVGAGVFALTRLRNEKVPQEAIIGLTYAISSALAILVVEKTRGAEHLTDILTGSLLWVRWSDVAMAGSAYALIGALHFAFRRRFWLISEDPDQAFEQGVRVRAWDFLFYITFGLVISLSVRVAGVLLVFVFLVAPAILAFVLTSNVRLQLVIGWVLGTAVTVCGLYASWALDFPSGPTIIALYGVALALAAVSVFVLRAGARGRALRLALGGLGGTVLLAALLWALGHCLANSALARSKEADDATTSEIRQQADNAQRDAAASSARSSQLLASTKHCAKESDVKRYLALPGPEERLTHIREQLPTHRTNALELLFVTLSDEELPLLYREEGVVILAQAAETDFGYDVDVSAAENAAALQRFCTYLRQPLAGR